MQDTLVQTLQELVRFDTTNPPGNEMPLLLYLCDRLQQEGIEPVLLESAPGRGNLVARLSGDGSERPLLLLSHVDVVVAEASAWEHPPFAGEIHDGYIWGRGTLDMKGLTAIELELFLRLKREKVPLKRDVILAATSDEEAGGAAGAKWLVNHHFDLVDAEYVINEGGGLGIQLGDRWLFGCQTAEKGVCWSRLRARGESGHASRPHPNMAVPKLAAAVERLSRARLPQHIVPTMERYIYTLAKLSHNQVLLDLLDPQKEEEALKRIADQALALNLNALTRNTAVPTILRAGEKVNVIPSVAEAEVDCRLIPGQTPEDAIREMQQVIGDEEIEIEAFSTSPGVESTYETPLFEVIQQVMDDVQPGSVVVPYMTTGATDGRYFAAKGCKVYGFWPLKRVVGEPDLLQLYHAHNERVSIDNLQFGMDVLWEVVRRFCGK